ncbi:MAG TPA: OsmC family protein [Acidimicrobiales bacterium]|nr:OsmC family protein [Acidimicrobiales bacterium]
MSDATYEVTASAGRLRPAPGVGVAMPHRWSADGVVVEAEFTGAHLYLLAAAGCVLNDVYREAERMRIPIDGVRVRATGGFDAGTWVSTGIEYRVDVASEAGDAEVEDLLRVVDDVAEMPRALRAGATVARRPGVDPEP